MAKMSDADRRTFWARYMEYVSRRREVVAVRKPELRAAVDALDDFIEANRSAIDAAEAAGTLQQWAVDNRQAINQAIPQPARSALTTNQKEYLVKAVYRRDAENGA